MDLTVLIKFLILQRLVSNVVFIGIGDVRLHRIANTLTYPVTAPALVLFFFLMVWTAITSVLAAC